MRFGVGLFSLQNTAMQPAHWAGAYREMREYAALMEELGYDELWLSEHHFFYDGYCPALLPAAASVLSVTERLRVGTGMLLLPMHRWRNFPITSSKLARPMAKMLCLRGLAILQRIPQSWQKCMRLKRWINCAWGTSR